MNRKILSIMFLGMLLLTGFTELSALSVIRMTNDIGEKGIFEAELGRRGNDISKIYLNGNYQVKERFTVVNGTATLGEKEGHFRGVFKDNHFIMRIPIRGQALLIIGRLNFNEDGITFQGVWFGRGTPLKGWITGSFTPT